jgi:hypothetical protein
MKAERDEDEIENITSFFKENKVKCEKFKYNLHDADVS